MSQRYCAQRAYNHDSTYWNLAQPAVGNKEIAGLCAIGLHQPGEWLQALSTASELTVVN